MKNSVFRDKIENSQMANRRYTNRLPKSVLVMMQCTKTTSDLGHTLDLCLIYSTTTAIEGKVPRLMRVSEPRYDLASTSSGIRYEHAKVLEGRKIRRLRMANPHRTPITVHGGRFGQGGICCLLLQVMIQPSVSAGRTSSIGE